MRTDYRTIISMQSADLSNENGKLAIDAFVESVRHFIGSFMVALGGLDVLVFTGGVGEHSSQVREQAAAGLAFLGVSIDDARNRDVRADGEIGADGGPVRTLVLTAREDIEIAQQTRAVLSGEDRADPLP